MQREAAGAESCLEAGAWACSWEDGAAAERGSAMTPLQEAAIQFLPFARATVLAKLTPEGIPYIANMLGMDVKEAGEIPVYSMVNRIPFLFAKDFIATSQLP